MRLFVGVELGRIKVLALHLHENAMQDAVAQFRERLQDGGQVEQECIAGVRLQRLSGRP